MNIAKVLIPLVGLAIAAPAGATSWNTAIGVGLTAVGGSIYCGTSTSTLAATCQSSGSAGLQAGFVTLTGYSTPGPEVDTTTSPTDSGDWLDARIAIYSGGGVGISNMVEPNASETSVSEHAIDNNGINDMFVVDFGSNNWDVSSFSLGYVCNASNDVCSGATVNVAAWVGGSSAIDFNTVSFSGEGAAATLPGFSSLAFSPDPGGTGTRTETTSAMGRYLVIAGDLARYTDAFKVSGVAATQFTPPGGSVPLPGTVPLIVLGLLALTWASRRRTVTIRR